MKFDDNDWMKCGLKPIPEELTCSPYNSCSPLYCGCGVEVPKKYKEDCYFYYEEPDMGAHIPTCNYFGKLGFCPCDGCKKHIKNQEIFKKAKEMVDSY